MTCRVHTAYSRKLFDSNPSLKRTKNFFPQSGSPITIWQISWRVSDRVSCNKIYLRAALTPQKIGCYDQSIYVEQGDSPCSLSLRSLRIYKRFLPAGKFRFSRQDTSEHSVGQFCFISAHAPWKINIHNYTLIPKGKSDEWFWSSLAPDLIIIIRNRLIIFTLLD